jgi:hypothetical protein
VDEQHRGEHAGGRCRQEGCGPRAPVRIVDRYVLAGAEKPAGGGPTDLVLLRQKAEVERRLDHFECQNPDIRVVRFRPAPAFKRESAEGLRRLFGGPFFPNFQARPEFNYLVPEP